jgi:hypothetical protein
MSDVLPLGMARVHNLQFKVVEATLAPDRFDQDPFNWVLEVQTDRLRREGTTWGLYFYGHGVPMTGAIGKLSSGDVLLPPVENERGEAYFTMYIWEHQPTYDIRIAILEAPPDLVRMRITGRCDVGWDDEIGAAVPFEIHADFRIAPSAPPLEFAIP